MRLKLKDGTHKTLVKVKLEDIWTMPMHITIACSPFGKYTQEWTTKVMVMSWAIEWIIWLVALVSMIQSSD